ncbi:MAG: AAA domain-containing protein [Promethearchaeota archaeon]
MEELKKKLIKKFGNEIDFYEIGNKFEIPSVKSNKVEDNMLKLFGPNDVYSYSGSYQIKIYIQKKREKNQKDNSERTIIEIPPHFLDLKDEELKKSIEKHIEELINNIEDKNEFVLELNSKKYHFILIQRDDCFLMVDLAKNNYPPRDFIVNIEFRNYKCEKGNIIEIMKNLLEKYLIWQYENNINKFLEYPKYLSKRFEPFKKILVSEKKALSKESYKPKAKYKDIIIRENKQLNEESEESDNLKKSIEILMLFNDSIPRQLREKGNLIRVVWNDKNDKKEKNVIVKVEDWDDDELVLIFSEQENVDKLKDANKEGKIILKENLTNNRRKQNALDLLQQPYLTPLQNLVDMMLRPEVFTKLIPRSVIPFDYRINPNNPETYSQYKALEKMCSSEDLTIIQGPPGSGKTTLIIELIKQAVNKGERVLMCAPTHIAVDNILEILDENKDLKLQMVRIGRGYKVQENLKKYLLKELVQNWKQFIFFNPENYKGVNFSKNDLRKINNEFISNSHARSVIEDMIINTSNLICGTSTGVVIIYDQHHYIKDFDLMIIDESSKATILEFLIAATRAKRWIIVGDQNQLAPYIEDREIRIFFQEYFEDNFDKEDIEELNKYARKKLKSRKNRRKIDLADWRLSEDIEVYDFVKLLMHKFRLLYEGTHFINKKESYIEREREEIYRLFNYDRKKILIFEQLIEILGSCYHYFYNRIYNVDKSRFQMLEYQYRMPPLLGNFISSTFYDGRLKCAENTHTHGFNIRVNKIFHKNNKYFPVFTFISTSNYNEVFKTDRRRKYNSSSFNPLESEIVIKILEQIYDTFKNYGINNCWKYKKGKKVKFDKKNPLTIGIISFYAAQFKDIRRRIRDSKFIERKFGTYYKFKDLDVEIQISIVDRFQGREKDIIIIPLTRSNKAYNIGFLKSHQRANVAFSRAKHNLFIVGDHQFYENLKMNIENEPYIKLIKYCKDNNLLFILKPNLEIIKKVIKPKYNFKRLIKKEEKEKLESLIESIEKKGNYSILSKNNINQKEKDNLEENIKAKTDVQIDDLDKRINPNVESTAQKENFNNAQKSEFQKELLKTDKMEKLSLSTTPNNTSNSFNEEKIMSSNKDTEKSKKKTLKTKKVKVISSVSIPTDRIKHPDVNKKIQSNADMKKSKNKMSKTKKVKIISSVSIPADRIKHLDDNKKIQSNADMKKSKNKMSKTKVKKISSYTITKEKIKTDNINNK